MYLAAVEDLHGIICEVYQKVSTGMMGVNLMHLVIGWLYRRPDEFVHLLEQKETYSLVILAYWTFLLQYMRSTWFMQGWAEHVLSGICSCLRPEFRPWIEWPLQKVRLAE